jgi:hypothetical protein
MTINIDTEAFDVLPEIKKTLDNDIFDLTMDIGESMLTLRLNKYHLQAINDEINNWSKYGTNS